ncbi:MAG: ATP phosphoribosyltransferase regulatory subunit, partial [Bacteroidales bacterium]|nr:ATP phosphoribosyltransferase regulatory subunit [Bacteroidales bacterium]
MNYSVVKGTRDFLPNQMIKRNYIFNSIKSIFELHGFCPIETPSIENLSTLMGKYGEEGDRLIYKILNSGDFLKGVDLSNPSDINYKSIANKIAEKGLRYDLTV